MQVNYIHTMNYSDNLYIYNKLIINNLTAIVLYTYNGLFRNYLHTITYMYK